MDIDERVTVPNPTTGEPMEVCPSVEVAPCPHCKAPRGVPCRGSRWRYPDKKGVGGGNAVWWWRESHVSRRDLARGVLRESTEAGILYHEATIRATMEPHDNWGYPVDVDEADYDLVDQVQETTDPLQDRNNHLLQQEREHPHSVA